MGCLSAKWWGEHSVRAVLLPTFHAARSENSPYQTGGPSEPVNQMADLADISACPLCGGTGPFRPLADRWYRHHLLCPDCRLIFTVRDELPSPDAARARYAMHQNGPGDPGYVAFLSRAVTAAAPHLAALAASTPGARALDYGCGPGPALHVPLADFGIPCDCWDPCFFPEPPPLGRYRVVFATEVVEHFREPARDWAAMLARVAPGGLLVVMSGFWTDVAAFPSWSYADDFTHVAFHHPDTLRWIARHHGLSMLPATDRRIVVFRVR